MSGPFYAGSLTAGGAIAAGDFVYNNSGSLAKLTSDTGVVLGIATRALESGDQALGLVSDTNTPCWVTLASGVNPSPGAFLSAGSSGATVSASGDVRHAQVVAAPTAAGKPALCKLWLEGSLVP